MTQRDLNEEWAFSQLEAWADGSLTGEARARLDAAIAADPLLAAAAERAVAVRRALRGSPRLPMPRGLRGRLLAIPRGSPRAQSFALPAFASVAAALAVVAGALWHEPEPPPVTIDPRVVEAAEDLETAMRYLQMGAQITHAHVTSAVGTGLRDAFVASRNALAEETDENGG
jgi:hypothetical protein